MLSISEIAEVLDLPVDELTGLSRRDKYSCARHAIARVLRDAGVSLKAISDMLGRSNHTSAWYGANQHQSLYGINLIYTEYYNKLAARVQGTINGKPR